MSGGPESGEPRVRLGLISSPRAYFGRASRVATGTLRGGISDVEEVATASGRGPLVYRAGEPAMRLFPEIVLPLPVTMPLAGATATLSGIRDGEHEKLYVDLGTTLVRSTSRRDEATGTLTLVLSRTQSADTYRGLLASLRYVNSAPAPTPGPRRVLLHLVDSSGNLRPLDSIEFGVGVAPHDTKAVSSSSAVMGDAVRFNVAGDYTIFAWRESRRSAPPSRSAAPQRSTAGQAAEDSFFSGGDYRLFASQPARSREVQPMRESPRAPSRPAANDSLPPPDSADSAASVWVPERRPPPPGFPAPRPLRIEDVFGADFRDFAARRPFGGRAGP